MIDVGKALYKFWSGFSIPAYPEYSVPDDAQLPYITYDIDAPAWRDSSIYNAKVWYRDTSFVDIFNKVAEISDAIGEGVRLPMIKGSIFLFKEANFFQMAPQENDADNMKVALLTMIIHVLS